MFELVTSLLGGHKEAPAAHAEPDHVVAPAAPAPAAAPASGGVLDMLFHPITALKTAVSTAGVDVRNSIPTPAPAGGVAPPQEAPPKATAEQLKVADASRTALHDKLDKLGLSAEQKQRVLARTKGLSGDALVTEMHAIDNAMAGKNADRALATYADLDEITAKNPEAKNRITPEIVGELVTGVANSRTTSDRGQAGILGGKQARDSAQALIDMSAEEYAQTQALLKKAGQDDSGKLKPDADPAAEQALILKAVAARRDQYHHTFWGDVKHFFGAETPSSKANNEIAGFAKEIRGMNRDDLIQSTTLMDVDDRNTSTRDPEKAGKVDDKVDNDGLFQRFTMSCAPTTAQIIRGEVDPVYALQLRKNNFNDPDPNSEFAQEQKKVLEDNGGQAISRMGEDARNQAAKKIEEMKKSGEFSAEQTSSMRKLFKGEKLEGDDQKKAQEALAALRKKNDGHPTEAELREIQDHYGNNKTDVGIDMQPALNTIAGDKSHVAYDDKDLGTAGMTDGNLANVDKLLKDGQQVPFRIAGTGNSGHAMMVSDVRGKAGARQYLVTDPSSGATRWVGESDLKSGAFTTKTFDLGQAQVTDVYADQTQTI